MVPVVIAVLLVSSPGYERCMAAIDHNALGNSQMLACAITDMDRADGAPNARYREVMRRLSPARRETVRLEERQWIRQRRACCLAAEQDPIPTPEINRMRCLVRTTDERTAYLGRLR